MTIVIILNLESSSFTSFEYDEYDNQISTEISWNFYFPEEVSGVSLYTYTFSLLCNNGFIESGDQCILYGDLNLDTSLNILDILVLVNCIIDGDCNPNSDLNEDENNDILDIVMLVNLILSI